MTVILGTNHMFLYPESIVNEKVHTESLRELAYTDKVEALDVWVWRGAERSREEISILRDCKKVINYNIGDRFGEDVALPSSKNKADRDRAYDLIMREINFGLEAGSKKFIFGSGPDDTADHKGAVERYSEFVAKVLSNIPKDCVMSLEPTDRDIDKHFLFGPVGETVDFIKKLNNDGYKNLGMLLDMCHIPIMHETMESSIEKSKDVLNHIHLGNGVVNDTTDKYYGDKHPSWNYAAGEYSDADGEKFIRILREIGYTDKDNATISFEMRPYEGKTPAESLARFVEVYNKAMTD